MTAPATGIRLLVADVDGTLVTRDKVLTPRAVAAVGELRTAGILFALTSGRPPRGMQMLIAPLELESPLAAFNGGLIVAPDMTVITQRIIPDPLVPEIVAALDAAGLDAWIYRGADWFVRTADAPHVGRETATVQFSPSVVPDFHGLLTGIAKVVGVSDDHDAIAAATLAVQAEFGAHVSAARSQPYYLDVTHPDANKGGVVAFLAAHYGIPAEGIATIGDMPNDVLMFMRSGLSIAMGQADPEVHRAARHVTASNDDEGFALAVERFILTSPDTATPDAAERT
jgi:Cof subfamily protein (haloacid dehalogenase superfamily)